MASSRHVERLSCKQLEYFSFISQPSVEVRADLSFRAADSVR